MINLCETKALVNFSFEFEDFCFEFSSKDTNLKREALKEKSRAQYKNLITVTWTHKNGECEIFFIY